MFKYLNRSFLVRIFMQNCALKELNKYAMRAPVI